MGTLLLIVIFAVSALVVTILAIGVIAVLGRRIGLDPHSDPQSGAVIALFIGVVGAAIITFFAYGPLSREDRDFASLYEPQLARIYQAYRSASPDEALAAGDFPGEYDTWSQHFGAGESSHNAPGETHGIVIVSDSGTGFSLEVDRMRELPEPCRASPAGTPRFVVAIHPRSKAIGYTVGAGAGRTVTKDWTEHYLVDLAAGSVRHARSAEHERPQVKHERLLAQAIAASGCRSKS